MLGRGGERAATDDDGVGVIEMHTFLGGVDQLGMEEVGVGHEALWLASGQTDTCE